MQLINQEDILWAVYETLKQSSLPVQFYILHHTNWQ